MGKWANNANRQMGKWANGANGNQASICDLPFAICHLQSAIFNRPTYLKHIHNDTPLSLHFLYI